MGRSRKFDYQAAIQDNLIAASDGLTLDELLERSGLEVDRSTLFRHLTALIQQGRVERLGKARASRYRALGNAGRGEVQAPPDMPHPAVRSAPEILNTYLPSAPSVVARGIDQPSDRAGRVERPEAAPGAVVVGGRAYLKPAPDVPESLDAAPPKPDSQETNARPDGNYGAAPAEPARVPVSAPDYGVAIRKAVRIVVREWRRCDRRNLQIYLSLLAEPENVDALSVTVEQELAGLHEGNLEKFGISAAEFSEYDPTPRSAATGE